MAAIAGGNILVASADGSPVYVFDSNGRDLKTLNALTGAAVYSFAYDSLGCLTKGSEAAGKAPSAVSATGAQR